MQRIIDYFKNWIPPATQIYRDRLAHQRKEAAERERSRLRSEQEELQRQQQLRQQIRL